MMTYNYCTQISLVKLPTVFDIGVQINSTFYIKEIDDDFFEGQ